MVKQIGDEFMLVFMSAGATVACGQSIAAAVAGESHFPAVRMGGHAGSVLFREADFLGQTVNVAARVADIADAGELLVTSDVLDATGAERWHHAGKRQLKGLSGPIDLYRVPTQRAAQRATDPVCGMQLLGADRDLRHEWAGSTYRFYSTGCRDLFRAEPSRYAPS